MPFQDDHKHRVDDPEEQGQQDDDDKDVHVHVHDLGDIAHFGAYLRPGQGSLAAGEEGVDPGTYRQGVTVILHAYGDLMTGAGRQACELCQVFIADEDVALVKDRVGGLVDPCHAESAGREVVVEVLQGDHHLRPFPHV